MARRYKEEYAEEELFKAISLIAFLYVVYLALLYYTNRNSFWHWMIYGVVAFIGVLAVIILLTWLNKKRKKLRLARIVARIQAAGLEEQVKNFITRFGRGQEKTKDAWEYRGYKIDWNRINEVIRDFDQKGSSLTLKDFNALMRHYINERENEFTLKSIQSTAHDFNTLSGSDFERILQRLYEKMGYAVKLSGRVGDQGGDLVATNGQERLVIQAKRYKDMSVGNDAVQQVTAAKKLYDCNKAVVVTTSDFTKEAIELAKANDIELVAKVRLQELLLQHLSESWN